MRFKINISELTGSLSQAMVRFPLAIVCAVLAALLNNYMLEIDSSEIQDILPTVLSLILGISLFTALGLRLYSLSPLKSLIFQLLGVPILILCYLLLDTQPEEIQIGRFVLLVVLFHLLVSLSVYRPGQSLNVFWQANQALLLRLLNTAFYSMVLYGGLSLALLAIDLLFGIDFDKVYIRLFIFIAYVFNTWFFVAGLKEETEVHFPKGLRIFTQFVLIPLVLIYFLILYAYAGKIIVTWSWPIGWVSNLILGFSITGILVYLLVYPILDESENRLMRLTGRGIFIALFPLVIMMSLAVLRRISDYGVTEERYYLSNLTVWLAFISVFFGFFRSKNIRLIPLSLALIALLNVYGPLSGESVSKRNQFARLEKALSDNQLMEEGQWRAMPDKVLSKEEYERIEGPLRYLLSRHHFTELNAILPDSAQIAGENTHKGPYGNSRFILGQMLGESVTLGEDEWRSYSFRRKGGIGFKPPVGNFDLFFHVRGHHYRGEEELNYGDLDFNLNHEGKSLIVEVNGERMEVNLVDEMLRRLHLKPAQLGAYAYEFSEEQALIKLANSRVELQILLDEFSLNTEGGGLVISNMEYFVWVKKLN